MTGRKSVCGGELRVGWRYVRLRHVQCSRGFQAVGAGVGLLGAASLVKGMTFKAQDVVRTFWKYPIWTVGLCVPF